MSSSTAAATALAILSTYFIGLIIYSILLIIANWKVFTKAGQPGWKTLIPVYNVYIRYKIAWKASMFWLLILNGLVVGCLTTYMSVVGSKSTVLIIILAVLSLLSVLIHIIQYFKTAHAFGHGFGFGLGLFFLNPIFTLIAGFGKSEYIGPQ